MASNEFPFPNKPKPRRYEEEVRRLSEGASHQVEVLAPGCGSNIDMEIFSAAGCYSDYSGCNANGDRDHGFYVMGEQQANEMVARLRQVASWLDKHNGRKLGITVKVSPIRGMV